MKRSVMTLVAALAAVGAQAADIFAEPKDDEKAAAAAETAKEAAAVKAELDAGGQSELERVKLYEKYFRKIPDFREGCLARAKILVEGKEPKKVQLLASHVICNDFNVKYGVWCAWFYARYCDFDKWPEEDLDYIEKAYWIGAKLRCEEYGEKSVAPWLNIGEAFIVKERYAEALEAYEKGLATAAVAKPDGRDLAKLLYGRANALFGLGKRAEALAALKDYNARKLPPIHGRGVEPISWFAQVAVNDLEGRDLDLMKMPRYTGAKAYPEPQQVDYAESFVSVTGYDLEVKGLDAKDRRLELLETKFTRFGAPKKAGAAFKVSVTVDPATKAFADLKDAKTFAAFREKKRLARVAATKDEKREDRSPTEFRDYMENEAYTLEVTKDGAKIVAKTKQGALWGIVSLIQLWDQAQHKVRLAKMRDWPDVAVRGFLGNFWDGTLEFCLFNKMNSVCHQTHPTDDGRFRPINCYIESFMGQQFYDFGLELFFGNVWMTQAPQLPMCSPRTLPYRIAAWKRYARAHIGGYYPLDDIRFPICPQDQKAYGDFIGKIDGAHQNAIFQAVIKEYPDWRFIVCPPPYMGPDGGYRQPESREHYLEAWQKELDPRIEGYWTGPRVKSYNFQQYHNDWVLKEYGRRPYLFQNGIAWHNLEHYTVDDIDWPSMYCAGTLDKVLKGYHLNSGTPQCTPRISTLADALWNIGFYVACRATERGLAQVSGEKMYGLLRPCLDDLGYFDKYEYGETDERVELEDKEAMERRSLNVETCWSNALAYARQEGVPIYGSIARGIDWMRAVMRRVRNPPNAAAVYAKQLEAIRSAALVETGVNEKRGETYVSPMKMSGGALEIVKRAWRGTREWQQEPGVLFHSLKGSGTKFAKASLRFTCETFPPGCDYDLILSGASVGGPAKIRISVNGQKFFEGDPKIGGDSFKPKSWTVKIPEKMMKRHNAVTIENLLPGTNPEEVKDSFRIRYVVIRSAEENTDEPEAASPEDIDLDIE